MPTVTQADPDAVDTEGEPTLTEAEMVKAFNEGARRVHCARCGFGHEGACK